MPTFNIFSRRNKPAPNVLQSEDIPYELRIQILTAMDDARQRIYDRTVPQYRAIGTEGKDCFAAACLILRRELGLPRIFDGVTRPLRRDDPSSREHCNEFTAFFEHCSTENALNSIEIVMRLIENAASYLDRECNPQTVAAEINQRFRQRGVGYQYQSGQIIQVSNNVLHTEATLPVLQLLSDPAYQNANEEFLKAHEHYRHGRNAECLNECLKAFESTMKIICHQKGWKYNQNDTAKTLIKSCLDNGLVPTFSEQQLTSLRTLLESGIPTARNKQGGHGQGVQRVQVSDTMARYVLHLTAATILLLVESAK